MVPSPYQIRPVCLERQYTLYWVTSRTSLLTGDVGSQRVPLDPLKIYCCVPQRFIRGWCRVGQGQNESIRLSPRTLR